ncbi:MAG: ATP-binding cassette domain-containing protein [Acidimicrobiaceae bacterium]|nr:ATP-binding cassette domain-containing protein [Acidimicrobiaceae bacterium]
MTGTGPAIEARGICKSFGTTKALVDVDLVADTGRVFALLGPNGAGKTTLVRILTTLLRPDAGTARVAGFDVVRNAAELRHVIGLTGQFAAIDKLLTGRENLEMVGELFQMTRANASRRADELLETLSLAEAADRLARTYSGGMTRRLDLAASLMAKPPLLFLDEPTTGLDPRTRADVWSTIDDLVASGTTLLLTTQYLEEADRLAHRIAVMDRGRVVAEGTSDELKSTLGGNVVEMVVPEATMDLALHALGHIPDGGRVDRERQRITLPAPDGMESLQAALDRLRAAGVVLDDIGLRRPSLDDVFLALTGYEAGEEEAPGPEQSGHTHRGRVEPLGRAGAAGP